MLSFSPLATLHKTREKQKKRKKSGAKMYTIKMCYKLCVLGAKEDGSSLFAILANKSMLNMALLLADKPIRYIKSPCY